MGCESNDIKNFINNLSSSPKDIETAIYISNSKSAFKMSNIARDLTPVDTGTLQKSWQNDYEGCINQEGVHEINMGSQPDIIATNPKHPNGEYYSNAINYGFTKPNGDWYEGKYMLENAIDVTENEMVQILENHIESVLNKL